MFTFRLLIVEIFRNYDRRSDYRKHGTSNYDSDESDGGNSQSYSNEPNNKIIVRGLAQHITEADVSFCYFSISDTVN
jgi:hypothetical protein